VGRARSKSKEAGGAPGCRGVGAGGLGARGLFPFRWWGPGARGPEGPGLGEPGPLDLGLSGSGERSRGPCPSALHKTGARAPWPSGFQELRPYGPWASRRWSRGPCPSAYRSPGPSDLRALKIILIMILGTKLLFIWRRPPYGWCYWKFIPIRALAPNP